MGTSTKLPGPVGGKWQAAQGALTRSLQRLAREAEDAPSGRRTGTDGPGGSHTGAPGDASANWPAEDIDRHAEAYCRAFTEQLRSDPTAFGLIKATSRAGTRLVDVLDKLVQDGPSALGPVTGAVPEERVELFLSRFVTAVVGRGGLLGDAAARRAAVRCGERLLQENHALRHAIEHNVVVTVPHVTDELFCTIYRLFLADTVNALVAAVIAGKLMLAVPVLPVIDPAGHIAQRVAELITEHLPTPCEEKQRRGAEGSVIELGRDLVPHALEDALRSAGGGT